MGPDRAAIPPNAVPSNAGAAPDALELRRTRVRQAAEDFEAMFISQMLAPVFAELGQDELFGGGPGTQVYRSMMVQEYGKAIARSGGLGIAASVEREMLKLQEMTP